MNIRKIDIALTGIEENGRMVVILHYKERVKFIRLAPSLFTAFAVLALSHVLHGGDGWEKRQELSGKRHWKEKGSQPSCSTAGRIVNRLSDAIKSQVLDDFWPNPIERNPGYGTVRLNINAESEVYISSNSLKASQLPDIRNIADRYRYAKRRVREKIVLHGSIVHGDDEAQDGFAGDGKEMGKQKALGAA